MKKLLILLIAIGFSISGCDSQIKKGTAQSQLNFRPPAYPLITVDPYFSIWAFQDTLYGGPTRHWTGQPQSLRGIIRVDGNAMTFLGTPIPQYTTVLPLSEKKGSWRYTTSQPANNWTQLDFDASDWQRANGAFSDSQTGSSKWTTHDIWVRRTFTLEETSFNELLLKIEHDDGITVFLNGVKAFAEKGAIGSPEKRKIRDEAKEALRKGQNVLAVHGVNTGGLAYLDAGLVNKKESATDLPTVHQTSVNVMATQTIYHFKAGPVQLQVIFTAPLLPKKLQVFSRPANYVTFKVHSRDGQQHDVQIYFSAAGNLAVNTVDQPVVWQNVASNKLNIMKVGTASQNVLGRKGDWVRIDWGYFYLASPKGKNVTSTMVASSKSIKNFVANGALTLEDDQNMPRAAGDHPITLATAYDFGKVTNDLEKHHIILAYDDIYSIEYFHQPLKAWWKKGGTSVVEMLNKAEADYEELMAASKAFDQELHKEAKAAGGKKYAQLTELAYRQAFAACKLVIGPDGKPLFLSKENSSNGSIGTVDILYPTSPIMLYYNPDLLKGMMRPIFHYTESGKWKEPFAPHDVGTYPIANGQTYGGDMPIEETGNMLIATAAIAEVEGDASFAKKHWDMLTQWADYLLQFGMDPKYQLTTDDFAGRTAHNANLSLKAIMGIASYGKLAGMMGKSKLAQTYVDTARSMAQKWIKKAKEGDHYKLTFTRSDSWSQKYNLVWDQLFDWNIFPDKVARRAIAFYLTKQNKYGLPLDSRATYTKSDWITWTATMANDKATFKKFIAPMYKAYNETTDRVPMTDWYGTTNASTQGFQARSVVGGLFIKMLEKRLKE